MTACLCIYKCLHFVISHTIPQSTVDLNSAYSSRLALKSAVSALSNSCFLHYPLICRWSSGCLFTICIIWKHLGKTGANISLTRSLWGLDLILSLISFPSFPPKIAHFLSRSIAANQLEANVWLFLLILVFETVGQSRALLW